MKTNYKYLIYEYYSTAYELPASLQWCLPQDKSDFLDRNRIAINHEQLRDAQRDLTIHRIYGIFTPELLTFWKLKFE
jgi:hypothetical protein